MSWDCLVRNEVAASGRGAGEAEGSQKPPSDSKERLSLQLLQCTGLLGEVYLVFLRQVLLL